MALKKRDFGVDGQAATLYTLENSKGMKAEVTNYGAILVNLFVPDGNGNVEDVVLGFDDVAGYLQNPSFFGATIGPNANRIEGARFVIDGVEYHVDPNEGENNLHSHIQEGFHKRLWDVEEGEDCVTFTLKEEDGNFGFPGNKVISVKYSLDEENGLTLQYYGKSDKKTVINPTNHTYFNLDGHKSGNIEGHELLLNASAFTPVVSGGIPTGEIATVKGTPLDFTQLKCIGKEIAADSEQIDLCGGYDHNWVVDDWDGELKHIATAVGPRSGRKMHTYSTLPGVQFYAGNYIAQQSGKDNAQYDRRGGFCLETQYFPNAINTPAFPACVFGDDTEYESVTVYRFE